VKRKFVFKFINFNVKCRQQNKKLNKFISISIEYLKKERAPNNFKVNDINVIYY
jgi:hypothetical protein